MERIFLSNSSEFSIAFCFTLTMSQVSVFVVPTNSSVIQLVEKYFLSYVYVTSCECVGKSNI